MNVTLIPGAAPSARTPSLPSLARASGKIASGPASPAIPRLPPESGKDTGEVTPDTISFELPTQNLSRHEVFSWANNAIDLAELMSKRATDCGL